MVYNQLNRFSGFYTEYTLHSSSISRLFYFDSLAIVVVGGAVNSTRYFAFIYLFAYHFVLFVRYSFTHGKLVTICVADSTSDRSIVSRI